MLVLALAPAVLAAGRPSPARAETFFCHVAQPVVVRDARRVEIQHVSYAIDLAAPAPGMEIQLTCTSSPTVVRADASRDSVRSQDVTNLNAANLLGMAVLVEQRPGGTWNADADTGATPGAAAWSRFHIAELRAQLDVSALAKKQNATLSPRARREQVAQFDALVEATVQCLLENASRSRPRIRKLRLDVVGWDRYRRYADVYAVVAAPPGKAYRY